MGNTIRKTENYYQIAKVILKQPKSEEKVKKTEKKYRCTYPDITLPRDKGSSTEYLGKNPEILSVDNKTIINQTQNKSTVKIQTVSGKKCYHGTCYICIFVHTHTVVPKSSQFVKTFEKFRIIFQFLHCVLTCKIIQINILFCNLRKLDKHTHLELK